MNLTEQIERMHQFAWWLIWGVALLVAVIVVVSVLDVIKPRRVVDRARKSRGIDLMANVVDEAMFFRSLRGQRIGLAVLAATFGIAFCQVGFSKLEHWRGELQKSTETALEARATALWLQQREEAPATIEKLEAVQDKTNALQEAIRNDSPDQGEKLEALKASLSDFVEDAKPRRESLEELGETLRQLEELRGDAGKDKEETEP